MTHSTVDPVSYSKPHHSRGRCLYSPAALRDAEKTIVEELNLPLFTEVPQAS